MSHDASLAGRINKTVSSGTLARDEKIVALFDIVRDIPFAIRGELFGLSSAEKMLVLGEGFCTPKHLLLARLYSELEIESRWTLMAFHWSQVPFSSANALLASAEELPATHHLALELKLSGRWIFLDATWDAGLAGSGVTVNSAWDGKSDTAPAVSAVKSSYIYGETELRDEIKRISDGYSLTEKLSLARFSMELNAFLKKIRNCNNSPDGDTTERPRQ